MFDLDALIHHHIHAAALGNAHAFLVDSAQLQPQSGGADGQRSSGNFRYRLLLCIFRITNRNTFKDHYR